MEWQHAVEYVTPYVVRITTPRGAGTGFVLSHSATGNLCTIVTAAHVVDHAHYWEQLIRIEHLSGKSILVRPHQRAIFLDEDRDTASILLDRGELELPKAAPNLTPEGLSLKVGVEVGWLGYPAVSPRNLCFFSGRVSAFQEAQHAYLVDGVAINGVSGGPTFFIGTGGVVIIGLVSAYIPNRATGELLPGLAEVRDVSPLHGVRKTFQSLDEARSEQSRPTEPPPPNPEASGA